MSAGRRCGAFASRLCDRALDKSASALISRSDLHRGMAAQRALIVGRELAFAFDK
jgi:hypothetical protein